MAEKSRTQLSAAASVQVKSGKGEIKSLFVVSAPTGDVEIWDTDGQVAQVETATVTGLIEAAGAGDVAVIITAVGMTDTGDTRLVAVANDDTAVIVAGKIRVAMAADSDVNTFFAVTGAGAEVILTALTIAGNDATMNIDINNSTSVGLDDIPTSANTTQGGGETDANLLYAATSPAAGYTRLELPYASGLHIKLPSTPGRFNFVHGR